MNKQTLDMIKLVVPNDNDLLEQGINLKAIAKVMKIKLSDLKEYVTYLQVKQLVEIKESYSIVKGLDSAVKEIEQFYIDKNLNKDVEHFGIIVLDIKLRPIAKIHLNTGIVNQSIVNVPAVAKHAIMHGASHVIMFHNHPSGDTSPSLADDTITERISESLKPFNIKLVDSIIIGTNKEQNNNSYYSYSQSTRLLD